MIPNQDQVKGKWKEIKGELRKTWGKITDDEFEKTKGDAEAVSGLIQQRYGESKEKLKDRLDTIYKSYGEARDQATHNVKENLKN